MVQTLEPIRLWDGAAPGSESWNVPENLWQMPNPLIPDYGTMDFAWNVSEPTLTPFLPDPGSATGAAVMVCPGGGYFTLGMNYEGYDVARWLAERGVAAFVLKYRVQQTVVQDNSEFLNVLMQVATPDGLERVLNRMDSFEEATADGRTALALIRREAGNWGVDHQRVGVMGFSAGARLALALTALDAPDERPAFVGNIYGPRTPNQIPADPPPLFIAVSADDPFLAHCQDTERDWRAAGGAVESHYYADGGHGWGMVPYGRPSDYWIDAFHTWLRAVTT
jgi:acetyl esterase/lipase